MIACYLLRQHEQPDGTELASGERASDRTDGSETLKAELLGLVAGTTVSDGVNCVTATPLDITSWNLTALRLVPPTSFVGAMQSERARHGQEWLDEMESAARAHWSQLVGG